MEGPDAGDVDESLIALDESIKNLNSGDGYESDECSTGTVKGTTSHISGTGQIHYPTDEELSVCDSVTSTKERSLSLRQTLSDERASQRFLAFVKAQGCANNIKFWFACERFSKLGAGRGTVNPHARDAAKSIFHSFLKSTAPNKVALKESTVNQIRRSLDLRMSVNPQLFAAAQQEVYDLMVENEYKQFLMLSGDYSDCSSQFTSSSILPADSYYSDGGSSLMGYSIPRHPTNLSRGANRVHGDIDSTSIASYSDSEPGTMFSDGGSSLMGYSIPRVPNSSRGASAVHSDIESTSMASYSDSEPPRMLAPPRRVQRHPQAACSDNETRVQTRKNKHTAEKGCVSEQFLKKVSDRLQAVQQDRENMQKAVQEQAARRGQKTEEIQKLEWYDFPGYQNKYVFSSAGTGDTSPVSLMVTNKSNHSPQSEDSSVLRSPSDSNKHMDNNIATAELNNAMQQMELSTRQMHLPHDMTKTSVNFASVDSGLSDSGRSLSRYSQLQDDDIMLAGHSSNSEGSGATLLPAVHTQTDSGLSSDPNPHVTRYLQQQSECSDRDKQAFAAASMILDSNPHLNQQIVRSRAYMGQLNQFKRDGSQISMSDVDTYRSDSEFYQSERLANWMKEQQQQKHQRQPKYIRPQFTEESSSDFTMHSSTLFMPRGGPYHPCSDSDDPRFFNSHSHKVMHRPKATADRRRLNNASSRNSGQHSVTSTSGPNTNKDPFAPKPGEPSIAVFYQLEGEDAPKRRMVADKDYTLMEFKKLFGKKGDYRFFFKQWCEEVQMDIKDELIDDHDVIPKYQNNKIFAFIEKKD